jgi:hypothetical protein
MARTVRSVLLLSFLVLLPRGAAAQTLEDYDYENLSFRGIGMDWGFVLPNKVKGTGAWGIRFDLGYLGPAVRIAPSIMWWSSELKRGELETLANQLSNLPALRDRGVALGADDLGTVDYSALSLSVDAQAVFTVPYDFMTYAGFGVGLYALNGRGDAIADTFIEDVLDATAPGVAFMAGAEKELIPHFRLYGEVRYTFASDLRFPGVRVGGAFLIPTGPAASATGPALPR